MSDSLGSQPVTVSEDAARRAEPTVPEPDPLALEEARNNHARGMHHLQRGLIGWCVGTGSEKPGNVATLAIIASFAIILIGFFKFDLQKEFESFYKLLTTLLGPVGLALGYLFGSSKTKD